MNSIEKATEEFRKLYFEEFGEKLSREEAGKQYVNFMSFMRVVLRPVPENK